MSGPPDPSLGVVHDQGLSRIDAAAVHLDGGGAGEMTPPHTPLILPATPALAPVIERFLGTLESAVPFDRAAFCRGSAPDEVEIVAVRPREQPDPPVGTRIGFGEALGADAVRAGLSIEVELAHSPLAFDRQLARAGFRYVLRVPISRDGLAAAAVALLRRRAGFSDAETARVVELTAAVSPEVLALAVAPEAAAPSARAPRSHMRE